MPDQDSANIAKKYRCRRGVSVRKSIDTKSPDFEEFIDYAPGDIIDLVLAPKHINLKFLTEGDDPAVEEVGDAQV